ncbi:MAG: C-3',4' desaturase CrtD, partial [Candidatus Omnitrophica bacterium CG07_land_8_20_14_0_80_50_8]
MTNEDSFDVAIIGAGITGLVAANYLAKDGLRVLLLEQHTALGGCCSYFSRRGFTFDCGAHSLGSFRPGGQFTRVFKDLGLTNSFSINKAPISDTVIMKNFEANFSGEKFQFVEELSKHFPS